MRKLDINIKPSQTALNELKNWQSTINAIIDIDPLATFKAQKEAGYKAFSEKNIKGNATFDEIKATLKKTCGHTQCCHYCQIGIANEIEHYRPKSYYPDFVFDWENYLYICGRCNKVKSNKFKLKKADGSIWEKLAPPPLDGAPFLINLREESGLDFLEINLADFTYSPRANISDSFAIEKAEYTIKALDLNWDVWLTNRESSFGNYMNALRAYVAYCNNINSSNTSIQEIKNQIYKERNHSVWFEMKRTYQERPEILIKHQPELHYLFNQAPEALNF